MIAEWGLGLNKKGQAAAGLGLPHTASFLSTEVTRRSIARPDLYSVQWRLVLVRGRPIQ